jgi:hypothetical protein
LTFELWHLTFLILWNLKLEAIIKHVKADN